MENKVTVFNFITEFGYFYNNVLDLIKEARSNKYLHKVYVDNVYNSITDYKNEVERTLEARILSIEKSEDMLHDIMVKFATVSNNCFENYELIGSHDLYEAYKFFNSVIDCYNELCGELGYN